MVPNAVEAVVVARVAKDSNEEFISPASKIGMARHPILRRREGNEEKGDE